MRLPPPGDQEEFHEALLRACRRDRERASVMLLWRTGMHASTLVSGEFNLTIDNNIYWKRPKTDKPLLATIPKGEARLIGRCICAESLPNTVRTLERWVSKIGERAGYPGICPLTLRHSRAIYLLEGNLDANPPRKPMPDSRVRHLLGCSQKTLEKHYAQYEAARLVE
jgi:integrase